MADVRGVLGSDGENCIQRTKQRGKKVATSGGKRQETSGGGSLSNSKFPEASETAGRGTSRSEVEGSKGKDGIEGSNMAEARVFKRAAATDISIYFTKRPTKNSKSTKGDNAFTRTRDSSGEVKMVEVEGPGMSEVLGDPRGGGERTYGGKDYLKPILLRKEWYQKGGKQ